MDNRTPGTPAQWSAGLESSSAVTFTKSLKETAKAWRMVGDGQKDYVIAALTAVARTQGISETEQNRRASLIMKEVPSELLNEDEFLIQLGGLPRYVKNGIMLALPPSRRPVLYGKATGNFQGVSTPDTGNVSTSAARSVAGGSVSTARGLENASESANREGVVVLLASRSTNEVEANLSLLQGDGFPAYRASSDENLQAYLDKVDVCGFVIDGSYWEGRTGDEQAAVLGRVASYSSLATLIVDESGFSAADSIRELVDAQRLDPASHHEVIVRKGSLLTESDLPCLRRSAARLAPKVRPQLVLRGFSEPEVVTIIAAAKAFLHDAMHRSEPMASLGFIMMTGGRSDAKVVRLYFDQFQLPVVVKVDAKGRILEEAARYREYIAINNTNGFLKPFVYFHGSIGVAIFSLVGDGTQLDLPAPTLEDRILKAWSAEVWECPEYPANVDEQCNDIVQVAWKAADRLAFLNKIPCPTPAPHAPLDYMRGSGLRNLVENGVGWASPDLDWTRLGPLLDKAYDFLDTVGPRAIIHGDVHLRNILCQDRDANIVDYSYCGPGHPAFDLVRLECALIFGHLRQLDTEDSFLEFQRDMTLDLADEEELLQRFPNWFSSQTNRALLRAALYSRNRCIDVLAAHETDPIQYTAAKFALGCRSMDVPHLQTGLIRGTVRALAPYVAKISPASWPLSPSPPSASTATGPVR